MNILYTIHILNHNYNPDLLLASLTRQIAIDLLRDLQSKYNQKFLTWNLESTNIGRSGMRQKILESTEIGWMISLDSDMVPDSDFISQMISSLQKPDIVYMGYHYYQHESPPDQYLLHWTYGQKREVPAQSKNPYSHFSTGIFALHTSIADRLNFDQSIQSYGHEDTLFGLLLEENRIPVRLTSMKAVHKGLSTNEGFIEKQLEAVLNLQFIISKYPDYENRLIKWSKHINKLPFIRTWISKDHVMQFCRRKLLQNPKQLVYLDLMKLNALLRFMI